MKLSKRHKLCMVVLGLALCGLVIDRTLLLDSGVTAPQEVAAAGTGLEATTPAPVSAAVGRGTPAPVSSAQPSLAERLSALAVTHRLDPAQVQDAFRLHKAWKPQVSAEDAPDPREIRAKEFSKKHTLEAVMISGRVRTAVVDGRWLFVGQWLYDFRLIAVAPGSATFDFKGKRVVLRLPGNN